MKHLEQARLFLRKALEDEALLDAVVENPAASHAIYGFHCQQAAEKLLKALLSVHRAVFRRTHDIGELLALLDRAGHPLPEELRQVDVLTPFAVEFRYDLLEEQRVVDRSAMRDLIRRLRQFVEVEIHKIAG